MIDDLFGIEDGREPWSEQLGPGTVLLHGFVTKEAASIYSEVERIVDAAPFRRMITPGGKSMSVATTNCGDLGWVSDTSGYRYVSKDPTTGTRWPPLPDSFSSLAGAAALRSGFPDFTPDVCLINQYVRGARMSLHQDQDERDFREPIVSFSLGLPIVFLLGGANRADRPDRFVLAHGDALVWGGADRLRYHGVLPLKSGDHPVLGAQRINLTFRKAA